MVIRIGIPIKKKKISYQYAQSTVVNKIAKWEMLIVKMWFPTGNKSLYLFLTIVFWMPAGRWSWKGSTPEYISTLCPELGLCSWPDGSIRSVGVYNSRVLVRRHWAPQARVMVSGLKITGDFLEYLRRCSISSSIVPRCTFHPGFKWSHPI